MADNRQSWLSKVGWVPATGAAVVMIGTMWAPRAHAEDKWIAVANSAHHESVDYGYGVDQATAESHALAECAQLERADDCRILASGPDCVGVAWDGAQPINHAHGGSGGGRDVVLRGVMAEAGPYANEPDVRCVWDPHA